jgi:hypothetical protein
MHCVPGQHVEAAGSQNSPDGVHAPASVALQDPLTDFVCPNAHAIGGGDEPPAGASHTGRCATPSESQHVKLSSPVHRSSGAQQTVVPPGQSADERCPSVGPQAFSPTQAPN